METRKDYSTFGLACGCLVQPFPEKKKERKREGEIESKAKQAREKKVQARSRRLGAYVFQRLFWDFLQ